MTFRDDRGTHTVHITQNEFTSQLDDMLSNPKFVDLLKSNGYTQLNGKASTDPGLSSQWLTTLIRQTAVDAEAQSAHVTVQSTDSASATADENTRFGSAAVFAGFPKSFTSKVLAADARLIAIYRYYQTCPSGRFVSHILLKTKAQADAALALIKAGQSFAAVAKAQSTDTGSAKQGGGLGCLTPNEFVAEFQNAADAAPLDVVAGPVKTQFGYHLILVRPWDANGDKSYAQSLTQAASSVLTARLDGLKVWVNPRYGTWGKTTDSTGGTALVVLPPTAPAVRTCRESSAVCAPATSTTTTLPAGG